MHFYVQHVEWIILQFLMFDTFLNCMLVIDDVAGS